LFQEFVAEHEEVDKERHVVDLQNPLYEYRNYLPIGLIILGITQNLRILFHALEPYMTFIELGQLFDNFQATEDTNLESSVPAHVVRYQFYAIH